jgi:hypothetical protein
MHRYFQYIVYYHWIFKARLLQGALYSLIISLMGILPGAETLRG